MRVGRAKVKVCEQCGGAWHAYPHVKRSNVYKLTFHGGKWVHEERLVMEAYLGQPLPPRARVAMVNGIHADTRIENLFLQLPDEPRLWQRLTWHKFQCAHCDGDYFIDPEKWEADQTRHRSLFCSRRCFSLGRPRDKGRRSRGHLVHPPPPNPDRWRAWSPQVAWAARMIPEVDEGPGGPQRYPDIFVPEPLR